MPSESRRPKTGDRDTHIPTIDSYKALSSMLTTIPPVESITHRIGRADAFF
tara:strand:+ start:7128 stop:7280 length:153 start_codon:yes stop_codon:yes gene_type:complete